MLPFEFSSNLSEQDCWIYIHSPLPPTRMLSSSDLSPPSRRAQKQIPNTFSTESELDLAYEVTRDCTTVATMPVLSVLTATIGGIAAYQFSQKPGYGSLNQYETRVI
jgi:hypothetical protein